MLGTKLTPILQEVALCILEADSKLAGPKNYPTEALTATIEIFMSVMMDKLWELMEKENMAMNDRELMAEKCGEDIRQLIKTYTDIDTFKLYNNG